MDSLRRRPASRSFIIEIVDEEQQSLSAVDDQRLQLAMPDETAMLVQTMGIQHAWAGMDQHPTQSMGTG